MDKEGVERGRGKRGGKEGGRKTEYKEIEKKIGNLLMYGYTLDLGNK